ncbi:MAG: hypothetical protein LM550_06730 [Candidatus Contendobacter sp.]|nr:hypothetical protein [Candidatus Contendobacter sp.]
MKVSIRHYESAGIGNGLSWDLSAVERDSVIFAVRGDEPMMPAHPRSGRYGSVQKAG